MYNYVLVSAIFGASFYVSKPRPVFSRPHVKGWAFFIFVEPCSSKTRRALEGLQLEPKPF